MVDVKFAAMTGKLEPSSLSSSKPGETVILSNITHGSAASPTWRGLSLRYVARGTEVYRIRERTYRVGENQFMLASQDLGATVEIARSTLAGTLGLCVFVPQEGPLEPDDETIDLPLVFPAGCSALGLAISEHFRRFVRPAVDRQAVATSLMNMVRPSLDNLLAETAEQLEFIGGVKKHTRFETLRKVNLARAYLHEVTDRAVDLQELARVAGVSRFQLLRNFRDSFGHTPAAYHRQLRLTLAKQAVDECRVDCVTAADRYGFAGGSSFSHAYRRQFGQAPIRTLTKA